MANQISINKFGESAQQWVWRNARNGAEASLPVRFIKQCMRIIVAIARDLADGQLSLRAMSLVYTTVIAVVPLIALSFSVLKGFGMHQRVEPALLEALVDLGDKRYEIVSTVMGYINNVNIGVLGSVGFAILIYSVVSMMQKIETAFNYAWQVKRTRSMPQRFRDYLSVIFVGPLLIVLSTALTTSFNTSTAVEYFVALPFGRPIMGLVGDFLPFLMMSLGFALVYMFLPNTRVTLKAALVGGMVTTIIWKIMGWGVANFVANSANHVAIYSAFASVIILMVWLYLGWLVLLVGASVAFYVQNPRYLRHARSAQVVSASLRERLALNILYRVASQFKEGGAQWTANALAVELETPEFLVDEIIDELAQLGYLLKVQEDESVHLARAADAIQIANLIIQVRNSAAAGSRVIKSRLDAAVNGALDKLGDREFGQENLSMADLLSTQGDAN